MGGFIKVDTEVVEKQPMNQQINAVLYDSFQRRCKYLGYPMNMVIEVFMLQYATGRLSITVEEYERWKNDTSSTETFNTTFNKEIYLKFKTAVKEKRHFLKYIIAIFMEKFVSGDYVLEYTPIVEAVPIDFKNKPSNYLECFNFFEYIDSSQKFKDIGKMQCPFCGEFSDATAENWVIIQVGESTVKHIACIKCKGGTDGKYKY